jgi:hypothetical protein
MMVMKLNQVVPFGRSLDEYCLMFNLTDEDLQCSILGVGDGPASFNAELTAQSGQVISIDPIYAFKTQEIQSRFDTVVDDIIEQVKNTPDDWVWLYHQSPEQLRQNRIKVMKIFTQDYSQSHNQSRYIEGSLPQLPFSDHQFDLAVCSHLLFLYSDHLSYEFHEESVIEMLRVANEVRIFPLLTLMLEESPYLPRLLRTLKQDQYEISIEKVEYELQKGGNQMLRIKKKIE